MVNKDTANRLNHGLAVQCGSLAVCLRITYKVLILLENIYIYTVNRRHLHNRQIRVPYHLVTGYKLIRYRWYLYKCIENLRFGGSMLTNPCRDWVFNKPRVNRN